jgi:hypothetical protein
VSISSNARLGEIGWHSENFAVEVEVEGASHEIQTSLERPVWRGPPKRKLVGSGVEQLV